MLLLIIILEKTLVILGSTVIQHTINFRNYQIKNKFSCCFKSLIKIYGTNNSLHSIGKDGRLIPATGQFLPPSKHKILFNGKLTNSNFCQDRFTNNRSLDF